MTLVLDTTRSGNFGSLSLHANFARASNGNFYVTENNVLRAFEPFSTGGRDFFRAISSGDITLVGHPDVQAYGVTQHRTSGDWVILTRETSTGVIGKVYTYSQDGTTKRLEFNVPQNVASISPNDMRAPKSVSEVFGKYVVRVVRGESGNMRFLVFDSAGNLEADNTIMLTSATPSALRDASAGGNTYLYILSRGSPNGDIYAANPEDGALVSDESVSGTELSTADGLSVNGTRAYAATSTAIMEYVGVPVIENPYAEPVTNGDDKAATTTMLYVFNNGAM